MNSILNNRIKDYGAAAAEVAEVIQFKRILYHDPEARRDATTVLNQHVYAQPRLDPFLKR